MQVVTNRPMAVVALTVALIVSILSAVQAQASTADPEMPSVIAEGQVVGESGIPAAGAQVVLFAWPNQTKLNALRKGQRAPLRVVGSVVSDPEGRFAINALPSDLRANMSKSGFVNLELDIVSNNRLLEYHYSATPPVTGAQPTNGRAVGTAQWVRVGEPANFAAPTFEIDMSAGTLQTKNASGGAGDFRRVATGAVDRRSAQRVAQSVPTCYIVPGTISYNHLELFANVYTSSSSIPATVTVGGSATHTMGVAVSMDGKVWTASGTSSIQRTSTSEVSTTYAGSHTVYNRVNYRNYANSCTGRRSRSPYSFYDLLTADGGSVTTRYFTYCGNHDAGSKWSTGSATSATIPRGVSLAGISLSAQSGYSSSLDITYRFKVNGEVCGNSTAGPLGSPLVNADRGRS